MIEPNIEVSIDLEGTGRQLANDVEQVLNLSKRSGMKAGADVTHWVPDEGQLLPPPPVFEEG